MNSAILISCGSFTDSSVVPLTYTEHDLDIMKQCMSGYCGLNPRNILCYSAASKDPACLPTRGNLINGLHSLQSKLTSIDNLYFYFSGHGFHSYLDDKDYLVPSDTCAGCLEETSLSLNLICQLLKGAHASHIVLFLDACKDVVDSKKSLAAPDFNGHMDYLNSVAAFYSCSPTQKSFEEGKLSASIFTYCLGQALSKNGGCRTIGELDHYLTREVPKLCVSYGKPIQTPYTSIEQMGLEHVFLIEGLSDHMFQEVRNPIPFCGRTVSSETIFAIDFGMSKSIISAPFETGNELIPSCAGTYFVPTSISFDKTYHYVVGEKSLSKTMDDEYITIRNFKRDLGMGKTYQVFGLTLSVEMISLLFIKSLIRNAEEYYQIQVKNCMVSTPANFHFIQNHALEAVFTRIGLNLIRTIGEPCCGALNLSCPSEYSEIALIVDLGGGTLDITAMELGDGVFETLFVSGDHLLGGLDYDKALSEDIHYRIRKKYPTLHITSELTEKILKESERIKKALTTSSSTFILISDIELPDGTLEDYTQKFTRQDFRNITQSLNQRITIVLDTIKLHGDDISKPCFDVILLGGIGSKIFTITELLHSRYPNAVIIDQFCEKAVIEGLCTYAGKLNGLTYYGGTKKNNPADILLLDCLYYIIAISCINPLIISHDFPHRDSDTYRYLHYELCTCILKDSCKITITGTYRNGRKDTLLTCVLIKSDHAGELVVIQEYMGNLYILREGREVCKAVYDSAEGLTEIEVHFGTAEAIDICLTSFDQAVPTRKSHTYPMSGQQEISLYAYYPTREEESIFTTKLCLTSDHNDEITFMVESDANRTIGILIANETTKHTQSIQLNHLYKNSPPTHPSEYNKYSISSMENDIFREYEHQAFQITSTT